MLRFVRWLLGIPPVTAKRDEFWRSYWERLNILFALFSQHRSEDDLSAPETEVLALLNQTRDDPSTYFAKLYSIEQRLVMMAPESHLEAEITRRLRDAQQRGLPTAADFSKVFERSSETVDRRAALLALVDEIQLFYLNRSLDRRARREASDRLNNFSWLIVLPTAALIILIYLWPYLEHLPFVGDRFTMEDGGEGHSLAFLADYHLVAIIWFGLVGAYFSRLISFQQTSATLGREAIETEFSRKIIFIRLTIGVVAAIIMYVLLRANMVAGSLFPDWGEDFAFISEFKVSSAVTGETTGNSIIEPGGITEDGAEIPAGEAEEKVEESVSRQIRTATTGATTIPLISMQYAQLLVWSLLAGFSERLIPDRFASIERNGNQKGD